MALIRPFGAIRPAGHLAADIAALPYDVYTRQEAKAFVEEHPLSFLKIDRAETLLPDNTDMYSQPVYDKARDTFDEMLSDQSFIRDTTPCYYLYALTMNGKTQTGLVGCASIDDYLNNVIRKHENTREDKELDRICHVDTMSAQTGPIFLAHRFHPELESIKSSIKFSAPLYDFTGEDSVRHQVWKIDSPEIISRILHIFSEIHHIYIADGHHRAASAVKVGLRRRQNHPGYTGKEEFNFFLSVLFSENELHIYDYNRVVTGLNGLTPETLLQRLSDSFQIESSTDGQVGKKGEFGMYLEGRWYRLTAKPDLYTGDPVADLDVSILQNTVLAPLFNIQNPKIDSRIRFVGGIRGLSELETLVQEDFQRVAFSMYPTSMQELLAVADAGLLMPPKSTWFEPKLKSGLFIHEIEK